MMPLSEIFFLGIVLWLLYRFVFNFFVPIVRTTRQVRQQFRNMQNPGGPFQQQSQSGSFQQQSYAQPREEAQPKKKDTPSSSNTMGEYIDFEEVK
jgi:hypothetical protein